MGRVVGTDEEIAPRVGQTLRRARLLGLSGWAYHVSARAGALGDVRPETVAASIGLIAPEAVMDGWMNSEGHRANIENCAYRTIGIGVAADGWYWTQMFGM